jgi:hypothetical protein
MGIMAGFEPNVMMVTPLFQATFALNVPSLSSL